MHKSFDDLTIADDFMFCKIMQDEGICKEFLEMVLANEIGKIAYLSPQNTVATGIEVGTPRLTCKRRSGQILRYRNAGIERTQYPETYAILSSSD